MLKLDDEWVWDFWVADDGDRFHLFYLHASKSLGDPGRRHRAARIGHAVSTDLRDWELLGDVLEVGPPGAFDETATWTGCVVRGEDGLWRMFYTGARFLADWPDPRNVETIGVATSVDLYHWSKQPGPVVEADAQWYETFGTSSWPEEAWRDPWVYHDRRDERWHMLVTARSNHGPVDDRGVIGHAVSEDLVRWTVEKPLTEPMGFGHLEVPQLLEPNTPAAGAILFCCSKEALSLARREDGGKGGVWLLPLSSDSPATVTEPERMTAESLSSGRIIVNRDGSRVLLAIMQLDGEGRFVGGLTDPMPLVLDERGLPQLRDRDHRPPEATDLALTTDRTQR